MAQVTSPAPLSTLPSALAAEGYEPPTYQRAYHAALNARIPATRGANGRWSYRPEDLPRIAEALGLTRAGIAA